MSFDRLCAWRSLQLDDISLRVSDINGRALALGAVAQCDRTNLETVRFYLMANARFVERLNPKTKVIQVATIAAGCCAACAAEVAVHRHEIKNRSAGTQLD